MSQPPKKNLPTPVFISMLCFMILGFGSQWDCQVQTYPGGCGCAPPPPSRPSSTPPPEAGCVSSQPVYTSGPRMRGEFTVIVMEFAPRFHSEAYEFSSLLRRRRINNYIFQRRKNNNFAVAVGRFTTVEQAEKMKQSLIERGFVNSEVFIPIADVLDVIEPPPPVCGCY